MMFRKSLYTTSLLIIILAVLSSCSRENKSPGPDEKIPAQTVSKEETGREIYGLPAEDFHACFDEIDRNQSLSDILAPFEVPHKTIHEIAQKSREVFYVRKLRAGKPYCILHKQDSSNQARFFIYEKDPVEYIVFDLSDSVNIYKGKKPVEIKEKQGSGMITSSLYETMESEGLPFELAIELSEIYAWTIDFYRLQKGDAFRVIYEEKYVDGRYVGLGNIKTAYFEHFGEEFYAFRYMQDSTWDYFDENANSLRKAFLKAPVKYSRISSGYTSRRFHPIYKRYTAHLGIDYAAPYGTPIVATGDGIVIEARYRGNNGNTVKIRHNGTYTTQYLHMSRFAKGIKYGAAVKQGDVIGYIGSTGLSTGPHVCYRFWKNGRQVNAMKEEIPPAEPIRKECKDDFMKEMEKQKEQLLQDFRPV